MKEMMSLVKDKTITPTNPTNQTSEEKKKKREEKQKKFLNAPICKHCGKKHPSMKEDECWELDKNAALRPASWTKSTKNT
jgi:ribosomal protein L19E